jgi:hypothetical protein
MHTTALSSELQCKVTGLSYNPKKRVGRLDLTAGGCCDMSACIAAFERIDKNVQRIETYSGSRPDSVYKRKFGKWIVQSAVDA